MDKGWADRRALCWICLAVVSFVQPFVLGAPARAASGGVTGDGSGIFVPPPFTGDRVAIVHKGRVVAAGSLGDLLGEPAVRLRVTGLADPSAVLAPYGPMAREEDGWLVVRPVDPQRIPDLVAAVVAAGGRIHAVDPARRSLEELFLDLVRDAA